MNANQPAKTNHSQSDDQPPHKAMKEVELACMDFSATARTKNPENVELRIEAVSIRETTMDQYGVGYAFEIAQGKTWKKGVLSRRNFGINNFCMDMSTSQHVNVRQNANEIGEGSSIQMRARVWHWRGDEALAKQALLDAMGIAMKSQVEAFDALKVKANVERLDPLPMPAPTSTFRSKVRP